MKLHVKKVCVLVVIFAILTTAFMIVPVVHSEAFSAVDDLVVFLKDVVMLNVTAYSVVVASDIPNPPPDKGEVVDEAGKIILITYGSKIEVTFSFLNRKLASCSVWLMEGAPLYTQVPALGTLEVYQSFLERYQRYTGDASVQDMRNALNTVADLAPLTKTVGNIKLTILESQVVWKYSFNGADYTSLQVSFHNPTEGDPIFSFMDDRNYYQIGDTTVNITSEQAISLASKRLENYSWSVDMGNGTYQEISDFNASWQDAKLLTKGNLGAPLVWYPYWVVTFYMDKVYPGDVVNIIVEMWAKDGKIIDIYPLTGGGMGTPENSDSPDPSATPEPASSFDPNASQPIVFPSPSEQPAQSMSPQPSEGGGVFPLLVAVGAISAVGAATVAVLFLKKKRP